MSLSEQNSEIDALVKKLRDAADKVEGLKGQHPEAVKNAIGELQSCCGTCTLVSSIAPCMDACIAVSPLM